MKYFKKIVPITVVILSLGASMIAFGNTQKDDTKALENHLENVKEISHNIFAIDAEKAMPLTVDEGDSYLPELDIADYSIDNAEKVFSVDSNFFDSLSEDTSSYFSQSDYLWYVPAENAENNQVCVVFSDSSQAEVKELIISNDNEPIYLSRSEVESKIRNELNEQVSNIEYFNFPVKDFYVVTAYIELDDGSQYLMPVDSNSTSAGLETGKLYPKNELESYFDY